MENGGKKKGGGGNAHDRAVVRDLGRERTAGSPDADSLPQPVADSQFTLEVDPRREWQQPLNSADSIGLSVGLVGTYFALIVPTVWQKMPAFGLMCFGTYYFIRYSHWTYRLKKWKRIAIIVGAFTVLGAGVEPQFVEQWRMEHMHSELAFSAYAPGLAYPDGDHYGIQWQKTNAEVRLTVTSKAQFPIQNLALSVSLSGEKALIAGMAQTDPEPQGCVVRRPRMPNFSPEVLRDGDGPRADVAPFMSDQMDKIQPVRDHYDLLCQRILAGESIPIVVAIITPLNGGVISVAPPTVHVVGDYETTAAEDSKRVSVDETVPISRPLPLK